MTFGTPVRLLCAPAEVTSDEDPSIRWEISEETRQQIEDTLRQIAESCAALRREATPDWRSLHEPTTI